MLYPIIKWQTEHYKTIMKYFRGEEEIKDDTHYLEMNILSKMFYFTPRLHRGTLMFRGSGIRTKSYKDYIDKILSEGVMDTPEYFSATRSYFVAEKFFGEELEKESVMMILNLPKGFPAFIFEGQFEQEVLIPPCIKWSVKKILTTKFNEEGKLLHILLCTPIMTFTWGYMLPRNEAEDTWLKTSLALDMGQLVSFIGNKMLAYDKPSNFESQDYLFKFLKNDPTAMCLASPSGVIDVNKAIPPPSQEYIKEAQTRVFIHTTRIATRPPEIFPFFQKFVELSEMFVNGKPKFRLYEDILNLMSLHVFNEDVTDEAARRKRRRMREPPKPQEPVWNLYPPLVDILKKNWKLFQETGTVFPRVVGGGPRRRKATSRRRKVTSRRRKVTSRRRKATSRRRKVTSRRRKVTSRRRMQRSTF